MAEKSRLNTPADGPVDVHFVLLDDSLILDWAGPAEALRIANQCLRGRGLPPAFALHFVGPQVQTRSSVGAFVTHLEPLPDLDHPGRPQWVVLVGQPGDRVALDSEPARAMLHWLRGLRLAEGCVELMCICAGAVIAAHAGLLAGHKATTHHHHLDELRQASPDAEVLANRVFVLDAPVFSSAGVTTGLDLTLHRIAARLGPALAAEVAQTMVVALRRGPQDPELSPFLNHRHHLHPVVHRVQDAVSQAPQEDWSVPRMAECGHTSPRHLGRLFEEHAGVSPLAYLQQIRLAVAQAALRSGRNVTQAAQMAGFSSDAQLRRAWHRHGHEGAPAQTTGRARPH
ncbi:GlxA family transcriptional regulator [Hydrogenophaga sp. MI9]|uniref:GlxA family transcriptional regulator n=1 Tax=Hydrogenophaga sp. MI9 TaxID=3453719 RepID=UPI003EF02BD8